MSLSLIRPWSFSSTGKGPAAAKSKATPPLFVNGVSPFHPLNASFASFSNVWLSTDPAARSKLLGLWRENGHYLNEQKLTHAMNQILGCPKKGRLKELLRQWGKNGGPLSGEAMDQILDQVEKGSIEKARPDINRIDPALLENGTMAKVLNELFAIDAIQEFATAPVKKSFLNKVPPIISIAINKYISGFISPFATFAVAALAASLSQVLPGCFVNTFPKLITSFGVSWFLMLAGFAMFCALQVCGWKHSFGELFSKTYYLKAMYLGTAGKVAKYIKLWASEGDVGVDMNASVDFPSSIHLFDPIKKHLGPLPFLGKFVLTLPERKSEVVSAVNSIKLNVIVTTLFLFLNSINTGSDFRFWPAFLPSAILSIFFNSPGVSYIVKISRENGENENKIVALRQILGIALFVFSAMTSTNFKGQFVMHPALMLGSQFVAGSIMLAGVGAFVKAKQK